MAAISYWILSKEKDGLEEGKIGQKDQLGGSSNTAYNNGKGLSNSSDIWEEIRNRAQWQHG